MIQVIITWRERAYWWDFLWEVLILDNFQRTWFDWAVDGGVGFFEVGAEIRSLLDKGDIAKFNLYFHYSALFDASLYFTGSLQV